MSLYKKNLFIFLSILSFAAPQTQAASISTSSVISTEVAEKILQSGGSAVDAACAASFAINIVRPYYAGIGGGGLAIIRDHGESQFYNFREMAPASTRKVGKALLSGVDSVTVPGLIKGCELLHKKYGKLSWDKIVQPSYLLAKNGFKIYKSYHEDVTEVIDSLKNSKTTSETFLKSDGKLYEEGEIFKQPLLASTLETIAKKGGEDFYSGELARKWSASARKVGVKISEDDLLHYSVEKSSPVEATFGGYSVETADLPASSGITVGSALRLFNFYVKKHGLPGFNSLEKNILLIEIMSHVTKLSDAKLADKKTSRINPRIFLNSEEEIALFHNMEAAIAEKLKKATALSVKKPVKTKTEPQTKGHTSHISIIDNNGQAASITISIGDMFGSTLTVPEHGFVLNNHMGDFDKEKGKPNSPKAGLRPRSNMSPTLLYEITGTGKRLIGIIGAAGGPIIPTSIFQFIVNLTFYKMSGDSALRTPRLHVGKTSIDVENSLDGGIQSELAAVGYKLEKTDIIWAILEAVIFDSTANKWTGVSETRYSGLARDF